MDLKDIRQYVNIVRHALGIQNDGDKWSKPYRNYFCASHKDPELGAMVDLGIMRRGQLINNGKDQYYHVTEEGQKLAQT